MKSKCQFSLVEMRTFEAFTSRKLLKTFSKIKNPLKFPKKAQNKEIPMKKSKQFPLKYE
jgi:hypothetical protein